MKNGNLFVPESETERIYKNYGSLTVLELDDSFKFNQSMGCMGPDCLSSMIMAMNATDGDLLDQFEKLQWIEGGLKVVYADCFNIVSNLIRDSIGENGIWYKLDSKPITGKATKFNG